ncbi:MAG: polyprenyl synthetase family protein [bacterium]|nr:polyprenyl synthetase family protein [bacterium]
MTQTSLTNEQNFFAALDERVGWIQDFLLQDRFLSRFAPDDIREGVAAYIRYGGKRLRPAILLFSCGAVGGDEKLAIPAASAVEVFHTWTLVHDDIIDRDGTRRGEDTVHERFRKSMNMRPQYPLSSNEAAHYGVSIAILAGDVQHGWGISMMTELTTRNGVDPLTTLHLINLLDTRVLNTLVEGEVLDVQFSHLPIEKVDEKQIVDMLWRKTGVLYEFCAQAGALIGLGKHEPDHPSVNALGRFSSLCGIAFQLQDDILGITGDEKKLGKPVGSDLREGKRTTIASYAYHRASFEQRNRMDRVLGNSQATPEDVQAVTEWLIASGGVQYTLDLANGYIKEALPLLNALPDTQYRSLLRSWAEFLISRSF